MLMEHRQYGLTLVDLKLQGARRATGPATYKSWGYEMAAYRLALAQPGPGMAGISNSPHSTSNREEGEDRTEDRATEAAVQCVTLIMNSQEPHVPVEAPWSAEHMEECERAFRAARELWVIENGYEPGEGQKLKH